MTSVEDLYNRIGVAIYTQRPESWTKARLIYKKITTYATYQCYFLAADGKDYYVDPGKDIDICFPLLRTEMAKQHENGHAWYTATFTLTPDGKFKMDFDYDHLPTFDIMPDPSDWLDEFKKYPRPELQAQIQDWIDGKINFKTDHALIIARLRKLAEK